ncbi:hypothetical protein QUF74_09690 [Candidatus Halobeggiatoa sp. HSG11]|nr:hypothetical protein [Candidatus Halobeggiatoa sp. HSG11]
MPNYNHCLRPIFTENIVMTLIRGESINIYGARGQGRKRLLEDLRKCQLDDTQMLLINMRNFACSYQGFLEAFAKEIGYIGDAAPKLGDLVNELERDNGGRKTVILLHNFDSLFDNDRLHEEYGIRFFDSLNAIKNRQNMALVCVTEKPHKSYMVYAKEVVDHGSWLELQPKRLPLLSLELVGKEAQQHFSALYSDEPDLFGKMVISHRLPYPLLEYFVDRLNNQEDMEIAFADRLEKWRKEFDEDYSRVNYVSVNKFTQHIKNFFGALEIRNIFNKVIKTVFYDFPNAIVDIVKHITKK